MVSVVIPAKGEREHLIETIRNIRKEGFRKIFVVVDSKEDLSYKTAKEMRVNALLNKSQGFASAVLTGLRLVNDGLIVLMDAENHLPNEITPMIKLSKEKNADLVVGSRFIGNADIHSNLFRIFLSKFTNLILGLAYGISDASSGFRVYRKKKIGRILKSDFKSKNFEIQTELVGKILLEGGKIVEYPIHFQQREHGESKFKFFKMAKGFLYQWLYFLCQKSKLLHIFNIE